MKRTYKQNHISIPLFIILLATTRSCPLIDYIADIPLPLSTACGTTNTGLDAIPSNFPTWPTGGTKQLTLEFTIIRPSSVNSNSACSTSKNTIFKLMIGSSEYSRLDIDNSAQYYYYLNGIQIKSFSWSNNPLQIILSYDLTQGKCQLFLAGLIFLVVYSGTVPTSATFDAATKICFGGDCSTQQTTKITYKNIRIQYNKFYDKTDPEVIAALHSGTKSPVLVADYPMVGTSGDYSASNSVTSGNMGPVYLGDSSSGTPNLSNAPSWLSPSGLSFTDANQKIRLPSTVSTDPQPENIFSFTTAFQLKLKNTTPGSAQTILKRVRSDGTTNFFNLGVTSSNYLTYQTFTNAAYTSKTCQVPTDQWVHVLLHIEITPFITPSDGSVSNIAVAKNVYLNGVICDEITENKDTRSNSEQNLDLADDQFMIGGFIGSIQDVKIFWTGSGKLNKDTCSFDCLYAAGEASKTCILKKTVSCPSNDYYCAGTTSCDASCSTCGRGDANFCMNCSIASIKANPFDGKCYSCSSNCDQCDNSGCPAQTTTSSSEDSFPVYGIVLLAVGGGLLVIGSIIGMRMIYMRRIRKSVPQGAHKPIPTDSPIAVPVSENFKIKLDFQRDG